MDSYLLRPGMICPDSQANLPVPRSAVSFEIRDVDSIIRIIPREADLDQTQIR